MLKQSLKLFIFIILNNALKYEYNLSTARKMWRGFGNALHYTHNFKILSQKLTGITGALTSYQKLKTSDSWMLSLDIEITGNMHIENEGLYIYIMEKPFSNIVFDKIENSLQKFNKQKFIANGLYLYFNGKDQNILNFGVSDGLDEGANSNTENNCKLKASLKTIHLVLIAKGEKLEIFISKIEKSSESMEKCGVLMFKGKFRNNFYIGFYAQSEQNSFFQIDLNNLIFESDIQNKELTHFSKELGLNTPQLFKKINLMLANSDVLDFNLHVVDKNNVNISSITSFQSSTLQRLDIINHLLELNLEQSEELLSYFGRHQELAASYFNNVLQTLNKWMAESTNQLLTISEDSTLFLKDLKGFNFDSVYLKTKKTVDYLESSLKINGHTLKNFQTFTKKTQNNLKFLNQKQDSLDRLPVLINSYLSQYSSKKQEKFKIIILSVLSFIGIVVMISLTSILLRLKITQRRKLFE